MEKEGMVLEQSISKIFELGYANMLKVTSGLLETTISYQVVYNRLHTLGTSWPDLSVFDHKSGKTVLLTTEIFGKVNGASYLVFSDKDHQWLTRKIPEFHSSGAELKKEYIKEIDNILSAAVISKLSESLSCTMYGNIPLLSETSDDALKTLMMQTSADLKGDVHVNAIMLRPEAEPEVSMLFVWMLSIADLKAVQMFEQ